MSEPDLSTDRLGAGTDDVYAALIMAHDGLSEGESAALNARLLLLLLNLVGDRKTLLKAIEAARHPPSR